MAGFISEEHGAAWQPVHQRYEAEIKAVGDNFRDALKPLIAERAVELDREHGKYVTACQAIYKKCDDASKPIAEPFTTKIQALQDARKAELAEIDARFKKS